MVVTNPGPGGGASGAVNFAVTGGGTGPVVGFSSTNVAFGSQYVGDTSTAPIVTLTNAGNTTLNIASITVTGANAGDFVETNTCGSIAPGGHLHDQRSVHAQLDHS